MRSPAAARRVPGDQRGNRSMGIGPSPPARSSMRYTGLLTQDTHNVACQLLHDPGIVHVGTVKGRVLATGGMGVVHRALSIG
ncbi:hypothetical protein HC928_13950 [bacterium]|nr:hypothetical protein [bacterium]